MCVHLIVVYAYMLHWTLCRHLPICLNPMCIICLCAYRLVCLHATLNIVYTYACMPTCYTLCVHICLFVCLCATLFVYTSACMPACYTFVCAYKLQSKHICLYNCLFICLLSFTWVYAFTLFLWATNSSYTFACVRLYATFSAHISAYMQAIYVHGSLL